MAAFASHQIGSRASFSNGLNYTDQHVPAGSCNYRDLSIGTRAPVCGCQRFYLNASYYAHQDAGAERTWCFCGHHACFHNDFSPQHTLQEQGTSASRILKLPEQHETRVPGDLDGLAPAISGKAPTGLGIRADSRSQSQSINTRVWQALNEFARNQDDGGVSDTTSKLASTAPPSVIDDNTRVQSSHTAQRQLQPHRSMRPPISIPPTVVHRPNEDYSATEVATPSIAGTPDFRALAPAPRPVRTSLDLLRPGPVDRDLPSSRQADEVLAEHVDSPQERPHASSHAPASLQELHNLIRTYSQRLEVLESLSFSYVSPEEIQERFELVDGRLIDLESWRTEHDREHPSPDLRDPRPSSKRRRLLPTETASFGSDASFDSNAAIHAEAAVLATLAANAETHPRIDALESRVIDLEKAALPSFAHPWHVQVALLPWGRELRGIWFSSTESTQHSLQTQPEEWTGGQAAPGLSFGASVAGAWTTESIEAWANEAQEWLSPKACGPNGTVFKRLASRGLVQDIVLTAADARHILHRVSETFPESWQRRAAEGAKESTSYQGLSEPFVPLRKARKSSRLRFLSPSELVTSATWTAAFLDASVFMKTNGDQRRLYVTVPEAYLQPADSVDLTWAHIRALPGPSTETQPSAATQQPVSETCWAYQTNLDHAFSALSSFGSHASQWSTRSQIADTADQAHIRAPLSPSSEARVHEHANHHRFVSLPSSMSTPAAAQHLGVNAPQRRVVSLDPTTIGQKHSYSEESIDTNGMPTTSTSTAAAAPKRRRISLSPEAERRGVNFSPRWSREPPSPLTASEAAMAGTGANGSENNKSPGSRSRQQRGSTPFAYATPHSNSNYVGGGGGGGRADLGFATFGDGDTEVGTEVLGGAAGSEHGEEEWEGVVDVDDDDGLVSAELRGDLDLSEGESLDEELDG
ncbi:hypothetical protein BDY17DRAFT_342235 [Neohortaea acidophila]|uniref:Uncharacterized protein n=1 Tax=Neohortaea acidophila TaxID=245834 RepID=A0A6A6Q765_9PEZI|nr:uncharacterized protein BDY17DRAFT_342235 [Neohortaea acidophila]KAF2487483.1 hypothetical protein BDY17DRAFT_342235 [Neohortaea acidophila]